jgi:hypothetical protein
MARELITERKFAETVDLCGSAFERGIDHTAIRMSFARALAKLGYNYEAREVVLGAMVRHSRLRNRLTCLADTWVCTGASAKARELEHSVPKPVHLAEGTGPHQLH